MLDPMFDSSHFDEEPSRISMLELSAYHSSMNEVRIRAIGFHTLIVTHSSAHFLSFNESIDVDLFFDLKNETHDPDQSRWGASGDYE